jgi:DNA-binding transcriptional ArsR family regulator
MASIQRIGFTRYQNDLSIIFKALGHPARIAIIDLLLEKDRLICKELAHDTGLGAPTVSHHLKILMESGLVGYEKIANMSFFIVNPILVEMAGSALHDVAKKVDNHRNYRNVIFSRQPFSESF